jgi:hypothetical protein
MEYKDMPNCDETVKMLIDTAVSDSLIAGGLLNCCE